MEKELAQSDLPSTRKVPKTIQKYHICKNAGTCRIITYVMASNLLVQKYLFHSQRNMEQQCINGMY